MRSGPQSSCSGRPSSSGRDGPLGQRLGRLQPDRPRGRAAARRRGRGAGGHGGPRRAAARTTSRPGRPTTVRPRPPRLRTRRWPAPGRWSSTATRRCTWPAPSRACSRSISRVRPSCSLRAVGNSSLLGARPPGDVVGLRGAARASAPAAAGAPAARAAAPADGRCRATARPGRSRAPSPAACARSCQRVSCCISSVKRRTNACCAAEPGDQPLEQHRRRRAAPARWCRRARTARAGSRTTAAATIGSRGSGRRPKARSSSTSSAFAEAPRQPGARQAEQVAERAQAHALQRLPVLAPRAEQPDRRRLRGRSAGGGEVGALRRRLRRRASSAAPCAVGALAMCTAWPSGASAASSRCSRRSRPPK